MHGSSSTRFRYVLTNTVRDGQLATGMLQPSELAPGNYTIRITAKDYSGNEAVGDMPIKVITQ
ncbi:hypothetical protein D3C77_768860 [compost metagenome]